MERSEVSVSGLKGGVASMSSGPKCAAAAAQFPASSLVRMWKYQIPSERPGLVEHVSVAPCSLTVSGSVEEAVSQADE